MAVKGVLLDIAGVLYDGDAVVPGAVRALAVLRAAGLPVRLITNTSRRSKRMMLDRLRGMGFDVAETEVFTAAEAVVAHLRQNGLCPFLLVHANLEEAFAEIDQDRPDAVVVGDAAEHFTYARLNAAFRLLMAGAPLLAIAKNRYFRESDGLTLDAGPFVVALEYAAGVEATLFGKPAPAFFGAALDDLGLPASDALMIGDDVESDVNGALAVGIGAALVRTGKFRPGDERRMHKGAHCVADVGEAVAMIVDAA